MTFKKESISSETQYKEKPSGISVVEKQLNVNFIYIRFWNVDVLEIKERLAAEFRKWVRKALGMFTKG